MGDCTTIIPMNDPNTLQEIEIFPMLKNIGGSEKHVGKGSPDVVLDVGGSESG